MKAKSLIQRSYDCLVNKGVPDALSETCERFVDHEFNRAYLQRRVYAALRETFGAERYKRWLHPQRGDNDDVMMDIAYDELWRMLRVAVYTYLTTRLGSCSITAVIEELQEYASEAANGPE